ncbi:MAG: SH3 domain-containing protein [Deltaproteobacteria bacterium]|nr:SH3 domain-containing protein [Deltaproteobacteria bacterium]
MATFLPRFLVISAILTSFVVLDAPSLAAEMVRVKVKIANIRSGPGKKFDKVGKVPENYPYRVLGRRGKWLKVRDFEGFEDWIYAPLTDRNPAAAVKVPKANVRQGPGTNHPIILTADKGVAFRVLTKQGDWVKVRTDEGDEGWVSRSLLWGFFEFDSSKAKPKSKPTR